MITATTESYTLALHHALLGNDFFQQHTKLRNVPLSIAQRVKKPAFGVLGTDLECRIERAARGDHAQVFVEDKNGLADGVDNALRQCPRISDGGELFPEAGSVHKASPRNFPAATNDFGRVPVGAIPRLPQPLIVRFIPRASLYKIDHKFSSPMTNFTVCRDADGLSASGP